MRDLRRREKILSGWGRLSAKYPGRIFGIALLVIFGVSLLAMDLEMTTRWSDLLPTHDPIVREFDRIVREYTSTSNSIMVVSGPESDIKRFADEIVHQIESLKRLVKRVDYRIDEQFVRSHGFMLTRSKDLEKSTRIFEDLDLIPFLTHINDNFEETYIGEEESLSDREKEDNAIRSLDGLEYWISVMKRYVDSNGNISVALADTAVDRFLIGDTYFISPDKRMLLIFIEPTFDITDMDLAVESTDTIQVFIDNTLEDYPSIYAGLTGTIPLTRDEMVYSMKDMKTTSILAFTLVILLFIFSFRMLTAPLLAGLNLILSVMFASGIIALFIDKLNIMTSMFAVILIGLGIDFSIHIISLYVERRAAGDDTSRAMSYTLSRSGAGIITGGLTTSLAFLTLIISDTRGIKEMGIVLGTGIISIMIITLVFLPSLLISHEKARQFLMTRLRRGTGRDLSYKSAEFRFLGGLGKSIAARPMLILIAAIAVSAVMLWQALQVEFDYNYLNMEPEGIPSVTLQDSLEEAFDMSPDFVMVTTSTVEEARVIAEKAKKVPTVSMVESISNFIPSDKEQSKRLPYIRQIRSYLQNQNSILPMSKINLDLLTEQLDRLEMNIYELGQMAFLGGQERVERKCSQMIGDYENAPNCIIELIDSIKQYPEQAVAGLNIFQKHYRPSLREKSLQSADTSRITIETLPEDITNRFANKDGTRFLLSITPKQQIWDFEFLQRFTGQMQRISEKITGVPHMFLRLMELTGRDGTRAAILTLAVVFMLLWFDFRKLKITLMAMIPLVFGAIWMVGLLNLLGFPMTFVNVMGIPMIIGIGIDDGVHLLHRYRVEGWDRTRTVLQSTGRAILLTSLTTIAGFGSLMIAKYRGFNSLGALLVLGVAACFVTSIIFLPALINLFGNKTE